MKFVRSQRTGTEAASYVFQISKQEVEWLLGVLKYYPQLDSTFHRITDGTAEEIVSEQEWLEKAMAQRRVEHLGKLEKFFSSPGRFRLETPDQFRFSLTGEQMEWLLQVLNDIRVGCWVKLGRPDLEPSPPKQLSAKDMRMLSALELSGFFQMTLLEAYDEPGPTPALE